jgi:hypothetical protein
LGRIFSRACLSISARRIISAFVFFVTARSPYYPALFDCDKTASSNLERRDFALDFRPCLALRHAQIVERLQSQPKLGAGSEVPR